jgi:hypothetical protein
MLYMWGCGLRVVYAYSQQLCLFLLYLLKVTCIKTCPILECLAPAGYLGYCSQTPALAISVCLACPYSEHLTNLVARSCRLLIK